ncbi:MAG: cardiolipin synthase [Desulfuromonadales bacterium]|nr:cardiolipin synthase [Desulfuromonadales bacterium]
MFSFSLQELTLLGLFFLFLELLGVVMALRAILHTRTSQGALAWAISLLTAPLVALPLYALFGRRRFHGYVEARRTVDQAIQQQTDLRLEREWKPFRKGLSEREKLVQTLEHLSGMSFTGGNAVGLLVNGKDTFDSHFAAIEQAQNYILVQFFIVHDDEIGRELQQRLIERQQAGVQVYFLYDAIGSYALPKGYREQMRLAGIQVRAFGRPGRVKNRFKINFRNHRKIVVVDGHIGFVGGHNVGDEYLGKSSRFGFWRDTHLRLSGPAVMGLQTAFVEDWSWAAGTLPELDWTPQADRSDSTGGDSADVMVIPSGPADELETCSLFFVLLLNAAKERIWLTSPYFVPNEAVMEALRLAALRGVDVRVMLPNKPDKWTAWFAAFAYIQEAQPAGVRFYRYSNGFLHQKTMLVDHDLAVVGTANLDNRSFRLNFEVSALVSGRNFSANIEQMLRDDFSRCRLISKAEVTQQSLLGRIAVSAARLLSPVL